MKTKNNSFKKAALPVVGVLAAAIVSLTSVTYAWFTSGNTATVDQIDVNVEAAGGLQISMGGNSFTWGSSIAPDMSGYTLAPVSTDGAIANGKLNFYSAMYNDTLDKIHSITSASNPTEEGSTDSYAYIAFDVYFRNPELNAKYVNLVDTTVTSLSGYSNQAVRMAFITQASMSSTASDATPNSNALKDVVATSGTVAIYEPNAEAHTSAGQTDYAKYNGGTNSGKFNYKAIVNAGEADTYYNRYTGDSYKEATTLENREFRADDDYNDYYVYGATDTEGGNTADGELFRTWARADDFTGISETEAAQQLADGTAVYVYDSVRLVYRLVEENDWSDENTEFYLYTPVDLYTKATPTTAVLSDVITTGTADNTYITLGAQSITKVTVVIWLEGQDADCTNTVAGYPFSVNLRFNGVTTANAVGSTPVDPAN